MEARAPGKINFFWGIKRVKRNLISSACAVLKLLQGLIALNLLFGSIASFAFGERFGWVC